MNILRPTLIKSTLRCFVSLTITSQHGHNCQTKGKGRWLLVPSSFLPSKNCLLPSFLSGNHREISTCTEMVAIIEQHERQMSAVSPPLLSRSVWCGESNKSPLFTPPSISKHVPFPPSLSLVPSPSAAAAASVERSSIASQWLRSTPPPF